MTARVFLCPGRGSYAKSELGSLGRSVAALGPEGETLLTLLEAKRSAVLPGGGELRALDASESFRAAQHLPGQNASPLIYACTLLDARIQAREARPVLVGGNSLGFYSALVVSGALDPVEGMRLVCTMAKLQEEGPDGGQILWTLLDDDWRVDAARIATLRQVIGGMRGQGLEVGLPIRLGGHVVVAGEERAMRALLAELPEVQLGKRAFPFRLPFHGPFHTSRVESVAERAREVLGDLELRAPEIPLVDGRGFVWSPRHADVEALLDYTLVTQVSTCFDLSAALRVALCDYAPDDVVLLAPGSSLRAPLGHVEKALERGERALWSYDLALSKV